MSDPFSSIQNLLQKIFSPKIVMDQGNYAVKYDLINIDRINTTACGTFTANDTSMTITDTRITTGAILVTVGPGQVSLSQPPYVSNSVVGTSFTVKNLDVGITYSYILIN